MTKGMIKPHASALAKYGFENCHQFNFHNVDIVDKQTDFSKILTLEFLLNKHDNNSMEKSDIQNLSHIYN